VDVRIGPITEEEYEPFMQAAGFAFGRHLSARDLEREQLVFERERALAARVDGLTVGTAMANSMRLSVPGGEAATAAITSIGVVPTHRRRGIMRELMRRLLEEARDRGEPLAALHTSEGPIYGRFGFGLATRMGILRIEGRHPEIDVATEPREIQALSREDALAAFPAIHDGVRQVRPGMPDRSEAWWEYRLRDMEEDEENAQTGYPEPFFALSTGPEGPDGYVIYQVKRDWSDGFPNGTLEVVELMGIDAHAEAALWRYSFGIDLVARTVAWIRPTDDPLLHMLVDPRAARFELRDAVWLRLVDVGAALAARRYGARDRIVIEVRDPFCAWNEERFELEGGPEGAECRPGAGPADLALSATDLGAIYLGGTRLATLHRAGRVEELNDGAVRRADAMFAWDPAPWCPMVF